MLKNTQKCLISMELSIVRMHSLISLQPGKICYGATRP